MMHYRIFSARPHTHFINIECTIDEISTDELILNIPVWRPGRYERGNFAKNIGSFVCSDSGGKPVTYHKISHSQWKLNTQDCDKVIVRYTYYANQPDAGACFCNNDILYFNPVHCCVYIEEKMSTPHTLTVECNKEWLIATSLASTGGNDFYAADFHELVDSPVMCSALMQHHTYSTHNVLFHVWIQGQFYNDTDLLLKHLAQFTNVQLEVMQEIPVSEYHFMIMVLPYKFYHGVEHLKSTVLAIGDAAMLMKPDWYNELIGVASHELFHVWNVKSIRPFEMMPYKYDTENYASTGYVYEGFTTYYGDLFLRRCGYLTNEQYFAELNTRINKHLHNEGHNQYSVMQSSYDTWLDGYVAGVPGRKTSIYDEGSIIAMIIDLHIIKLSNGTQSLDDVMRALYQDFAKQGLGYRHHDIQRICESVTHTSFADLFNNVIEKNCSYHTAIAQALDFVGCSLTMASADNNAEKCFGMKLTQEQRGWRVASVVTHSPSDKAGIATGDLILNTDISGMPRTINEVFTYPECELRYESFGKTQSLHVVADDKTWYDVAMVRLLPSLTKEQEKLFAFWLAATRR